MESKERNIDEAIVLAYLNGEKLQEDQQAAIEEWLKNDLNQQEARNVFQAWELSGLFSNKKVDISTGLSSVKSRIGIKKNVPVISLITWQKMGIAACILIGALTSIWFFNSQDVVNEIKLSTKEDKTHFTLPDNTAVALNKNSVLDYDKEAFQVDSEVRKVFLTGEAFFEVKHETNPSRSFIVKTHDVEVWVIGTKFLVKSSLHAPTSVVVTEGKVKVVDLHSNRNYILEAGQQVTVDSTVKRVEPEALDVNKLYWQTGVLEFKNDSLATVFKTLGREFGLIIKVMNKDVLPCRLTATFKKQSVETIIKVIEETHQLTIKRESNTLFVEGNGCK